MRIQKYFNSGKQGDLEEGILFTAGIVRYFLNENGLHKAPSNYVFKNLKDIENKDLSKEIIQMLYSFIADNHSVAEDILFSIKPDIIKSFVKDNMVINYDNCETKGGEDEK